MRTKVHRHIRRTKRGKTIIRQHSRKRNRAASNISKMVDALAIREKDRNFKRLHDTGFIDDILILEKAGRLKREQPEANLNDLDKQTVKKFRNEMKKSLTESQWEKNYNRNPFINKPITFGEMLESKVQVPVVPELLSAKDINLERKEEEAPIEYLAKQRHKQKRILKKLLNLTGEDKFK